MTYCAVKGCHNASHNHDKNTKITFHSFPSNPIVAARWIDKIRLNRKEECWKPSKYTKICSEHFDDEEKYTTKGGNYKLRQSAVPTKGLHIFCKDESLNNTDDLYNPLDMDKTQLGASSSKPHENSTKMNCNEAQASNEPISGVNDKQLEFIFDTPRKSALRKQLAKKMSLQRKHSKKIKLLKQKARRLQKKKNMSFQKILINLQKSRFIDNDVANILSETVFAAELYSNLVKKTLKNKKQPMPKYTPKFRKFCLTLNFYSPRVYNYVRRTFISCLPHPKTIYKWYRNVNGSPGFTDEAFKLLETKSQRSEKKIICALVADEMSIRPQNIKGGPGQVNLGAGTSECSTKATEAYTFMLVCLNEHWKIPLGYFLVHGLSGGQKSNLIKMSLAKCEEVVIKVVALTFDAHTTNLSAMELLGCKIKDSNKTKTTFKHPVADYEVAVFLDSCHMIKLIRNHFEDKQEFLDLEEKKVTWRFLTKLNELQENEGLRIANKLTRRHLEFKNSIMKVKLAS